MNERADQAERLAPLRPRLLRAADAAAYCGLARQTLYEVKGFPAPVPPLVANGHPRWDVRDLDAWIDARKAAGAAPAPDAPEITVAQHAAAARSLIARARRARVGRHRSHTR